MRYKYRKLGAVCLTVVILSVSGCGNSTGNTTSDSNSNTEQTAADSQTVSAEAITADASKWAECFVLGQYEGIKLPKLDDSVSDEEVELYVKETLRNGTESSHLTEGVVSDVDVAIVNYLAKVDGKTVQNEKDYSVDMLTSTNKVFTEALLGVEIGTKVKFTHSYEEDESLGELSGKTVDYVVKVKSVNHFELPEITDEYAQANLEADSKDAYYAQVRSSLESDRLETNHAKVYNAAYQTILSNSQFDRIPANEEEKIIQDTIAKYQAQADAAGQDIETFVSTNFAMEYPDFLESVKSQVEETLMDSIIWDSVASAAGISLTPEEYEQKALSMAQQNGFDTIEEFEEQNGAASLKNEVMHNEAVNYVVDHAEFVEESEL